MKILLILPARRLWSWHAVLIAELKARGADLGVRLAPSPPYPAALRGWLALERRLFSGKGARRIAPEALGVPVRAFSPDETIEETAVCIDLAGGSVPGLSLRFDGERDEGALFGALQARAPARLEVVDEAGGVRAASYPALDVRDELGRSLGYVHARLVALALRALDPSASPAVPPAPSRPVSASLPRFVGQAMRRRLSARLTGGASAEEHWRVALRRAPAADGAPLSSAGFRIEPGPADVFHADPFLFARGAETFLFVEAYPWSKRKGVIACAQLGADGRPGPFETVLEAPNHLSYPQVFEHEGAVYMLPETAAARRLELYRALDFPRRWERTATMLEGLRIADATLLQDGGRWWLFASLALFEGSSQDELFAWHGCSPSGPWTAHAKTPLVSDARAGRPAGRFVRRGGRLYRPAQDSGRSYGAGLAWREVLALTPEIYEEAPAGRWSGADFGRFTGVHSFSEAGGWEAIDVKAPRRTRVQTP